jgi:hypothetical protein
MNENKSNINRADYFLEDQIVRWVEKIKILGPEERLFATDFTDPKEMAEFRAQRKKAWSMIYRALLIVFLPLILSIIFTIVALIVISSIAFVFLLIFTIFLAASGTKPKIIIFTSKRIIFVQCKLSQLANISLGVQSQKKILSMPWTSISGFKTFEKTVPLIKGTPVFGLFVYSNGYRTQKIISSHDVNPFQFYKYIRGNNGLYKFLSKNEIPKKVEKHLSTEELKISQAMLNKTYQATSYDFQFSDEEKKLEIQFNFSFPFEVQFSITENINYFNKKSFLYNPFLELGSFLNSRTFSIRIEDERVFKMKNAQGWFLNLLCCYFYANIIPSELDVPYFYKKDIIIKEEQISREVFSKFDLNQLNPHDLKKVIKPRGIESDLYKLRKKISEMENYIIDFYPCTTEIPHKPHIKIVLGTEWIHMNGFKFTYQDVANITIFPNTAFPITHVFLKLRVPIIWTTSDGKSTTTHYQYGLSFDLPPEHAKKLVSWFEEILK